MTDDASRARAVELGHIPESEPCTCCGRAVTGYTDCGIHMPTWSLFCGRCALVLKLTAPRKVLAS